MAGRQLENPAEHGLWIGNPKKRQVLMQRLRIQFGADLRHLKQRLDLGGEGEAPVFGEIIKRFHAEMIAGHEEQGAGSAQIANGEGKHSVQPLYAVRPFLLVETEQDLGVGAGSKCDAFTFELAAKVGKVVDFAVVCDPERAV